SVVDQISSFYAQYPQVMSCRRAGSYNCTPTHVEAPPTGGHMNQRHTKAIAVVFALLLSRAVFAQSNAAPSFARQVSKVDFNTATEKELDQLPGIDPKTAKKIIAGRPYSSVADLGRAGVSKRQVDQITPLVSVSSLSAGSANRTEPLAPAPAPRETATLPV